MTITFRYKQSPSHSVIDIFINKGFTGQLTLRNEEFEELKDIIRVGIKATDDFKLIQLSSE